MVKRKSFLIFLKILIIVTCMLPNSIALGNQNVDIFENFVCYYESESQGLIYIDCAPGYATEYDRVIMIDPYDEVDFAIGEGVGMINLTWGALLFDVQGDNNINLAIEFKIDDNGNAIAELFDDRTGDGFVAVEYEDGYIQITEPGPAMIVKAHDGWWIKDNIINFNLDIFVDGQVLAFFGPLFYVERFFSIDGFYDVVLHVRDENNNGRPDLEWRQIYLGFPEDAGYNRTQVIVNTKGNEKPIVGSILWPYLGDSLQDPAVFGKPSYFSSPPPIDVDWSISRITHVNEFVGSRTNAGNYFIYSLYRLNEKEVSDSNFETPFAYYDLSDGNDRFPNLMIRTVFYPQADKYISSLFRSPSSNPINGLLYVWRFPKSVESIAPVWDYKISVLGSYPADTILNIGELKVKTFNPATLPNWVLERPWEFAALVVNQGGNAPNSEGIGAWGTTLEQIAPHTFRYLAGELDDFPLEFFNSIDEGYRGEVAHQLRDELFLYQSPIDHLVHLYGSKFGIWQMDETNLLLYEDMDRDGYIDHWQYLHEDTLIQELWCLQGQLIFVDRINKVMLSNEGVFQSELSQPPADNQAWEQMRILHDARDENIESYIPENMFLNLAGEFFQVNDVLIENLRSGPDGYLFTAIINQHTEVLGDDIIGISSLDPGQYSVEYKGEEYLIRDYKPASVYILADTLEVVNFSNRVNQRFHISAKLHNSGDGESGAILVQLTENNPENIKNLIEFQEIKLDGGQTKQIEFEWFPQNAGEIQIGLQLLGKSAADEYPLESTIHVLPDKDPQINLAFELSKPSSTILLILLLSAISFSAALIAMQITKSRKIQ